MTRPIHPEQQRLWERLDDVARTVDAMLRAITGKPHYFVLAVAAPDVDHASLTISNGDDAALIANLDAALAALRAAAAGPGP